MAFEGIAIGGNPSMVRGVMQCPGVKSRSTEGFTLIEILVVAVILAILIAISIPVYGRIRDSARATKCISNLHALGQAFGAYASDHEGKYPPILENETGEDPNESVWSNLLMTQGYVPDPDGQVSRNLFLCPFDPGASYKGADGIRSYAYNALAPITTPMNPLQVEQLAKTIMLAEWYDPDPDANPDSSGWDSAGWAYRNGGGIYAHHPGGTSGVLFYDLHVEAVKAIPQIPQIPSADSPLRWSFSSP